MRHNLLFLAVAVAALGTATDSLAAGKSKSGHNFKGNVELQYRTNNKLEILIHHQSIGHTTKAENLYGKESIQGGRIPERIKEN